VVDITLEEGGTIFCTERGRSTKYCTWGGCARLIQMLNNRAIMAWVIVDQRLAANGQVAVK
jgi:hypothetical protein